MIPPEQTEIDNSLFTHTIALSVVSLQNQNQKPIGLKAIALAAGVSHSTVSRALRNEPSISAATRSRIQKLAKRLGYRPDPALSALVAYRARVQPIGDYGKLAVLNGWHQPEEELPWYFRRELTGVRAQAASLGYEVELVALSEGARQQRALSRVLFSRGIRGVIVGPLPRECTALNLEWGRFSAVAIGYSLLSPCLHYIASNHAANLELAYRELCRLGYRKIGYCSRLGSERRNRHAHLSTYLRCLFLDGTPGNESPPLLYESMAEMDPLPWLTRNGFDAILAGEPSLLAGKLEAGGLADRVTVVSLSVKLNDTNEIGVLEDLEDVGASTVDLLDTMLKTSQRGIPRRQHAILVDGTWQPGKLRAPARSLAADRGAEE